jgi:hypothetical protein
MVTPLEEVFPGLARGGYRITSLRDMDYNCIAWAVGDTKEHSNHSTIDLPHR